MSDRSLESAADVPIAAGSEPRPASPRISVGAVAAAERRDTRLGRWWIPVVDRALGISRIDALYRAGNVQSLPPLEFATRALEVLGIRTHVAPLALSSRVPATGPVLLVCNHPYGAAEALALAAALRGVRDDLRILANGALRVFPELRPVLIATNPLSVQPENLTSIRRCEAHLQGGGALLMFPAGRVSHYRPEHGRITDGEWNRLVGHLVSRTKATLVPVHVRGGNGRVFHLLGRAWAPARMLLLARQLLGLRGRTVRVEVGRPIDAAAWRTLDADAVTRLARLATYVDAGSSVGVGARYSGVRVPIAVPEDPRQLAAEIAALPSGRSLLRLRHFGVYHAQGPEVPVLMRQIARERERVFRALDEGSGRHRDGDRFDDSYVQLFVWDHARNALVGAYRLGRTDELLREHGPDGIYLSQMFEFAPDFHAGDAALELGRSFVVPEYQKTFHALYLLWQGIGRYLVANPRYGRLYGTVSLSRQFDSRAVAMVCDALIGASAGVRARQGLRTRLPREWQVVKCGRDVRDIEFLSALMRTMDAGAKDLPVLLKHYFNLGARFHCVGTDPNFLDTPGLLLSVDVRSLPQKRLETFLGEGASAYRAVTPGTAA